MLDGERLEELRKDKGFTQQQLAAIVGVTDKTISSYEHCLKEPTSGNLIKLAEALDTSIDYLCGLTDQRISYSHDNVIAFPKEAGSKYKLALKQYIELLDSSPLYK